MNGIVKSALAAGIATAISVIGATGRADAEPAVMLSAPDVVASSSQFTVQWRGPNVPGDYIDLVLAGHAGFDGHWGDIYMGGAGNTSFGAVILPYDAEELSSGQLIAPERLGDFDIRYVSYKDGNPEVLARHTVNVKIRVDD